MPITPRVEHSETESSLILRVLIKYVQKRRLDITATRAFVRVNYKPFLLTLDLWGEIDHRDISVLIRPECVQLTCPKANPGMWEALRAQGSKAEIKARRDEAAREAEEASRKRRAEFADAKKEAQSDALKVHWSVQDQHKLAIEELKQQDIDRGKQEVMAFEAEQEVGSDAEDQDSVRTPAQLAQQTLKRNKSAPPRTSEIWARVPSEAEALQQAAASDAAASLPPVRRGAMIEIKFSKNAKKGVAARGDHDAELAEIRKKRKDMSGPLQEQAIFLKDKGDGFFRSGDFRGAANAYSASIGKDPEMAQCYANRAACHLALYRSGLRAEGRLLLDHLRNCRSDASTALAVLRETKHLELTAAQKQTCTTKCLLRRAECSLALGEPESAFADYLEIKKVLPKNKGVSAQLERAARLATGLRDGVDNKAGAEAAALSKAGEFMAARASLDRLIALRPLRPSCRVQRAECRSRTGDPWGCVEDATMALAILDDDGNDQADAKSTAVPSLEASLETARSRQRLRSRLHSLRAGAYASLRRFTKARADYKAALELFPTHPGLQRAAERVDTLIEAERYSSRAADLFARHRYLRAARMLTLFLSKIPLPHLHVGVLCNRAACHLKAGQYTRCAQDCARATQLLESLQKGGGGETIEATRAAEWRRACLVRRGTALCWQGKLREGLREYEAALDLQRSVQQTEEAKDAAEALEMDIKAIKGCLNAAG